MKIINKNFWNQKHLNDNNYWLTGSTIKHIEKWHNIKFNEYKNKRILEIGVGLGLTLKSLKKYTDKLYAADISDISLNKISNLANTYLTENLTEIPPVDLAISHLVFQHCTDYEVERIINDIQLSDNGIFSFQYAYFNKPIPEKFSDENVELNYTHFFRSREIMREIISDSNKKLINSPIIQSFSDFNWEILRVKNK